jgi:glycosyltransferase involved in cell wall biosynthesis
VHHNAPGAVDPGPFRERHGLTDRAITLATVCRLSSWMKAESLRRTIDVVRTLGGELPLRFLIVGDGDIRAELERLAGQVNAELGRAAVILTGALLDPREAYAAADIVVGMGGSALRAMAFAKPVVVVGERGFATPFTPETADSFHYRGMYGVGDGGDNAAFCAHVRRLAERPHDRAALGEFSRGFVVAHFALETVADRLSQLLRTAGGEAPRFSAAALDGLRMAAIWVKERRFIPDRFRMTREEKLRGVDVASGIAPPGGPGTG